MRSNLEIFIRFLLLGCCSFGGPAAHMGYFYKTFVEKLRWINESTYSNLVGLSQFLPGPGSSQVGFAIGLHRNGVLGGISAFLGFTLPSFIIMFLIAGISAQENLLYQFSGYIHGLKILAVVVVADACWGMYQKFCQDHLTKIIALTTTAALLCTSGVLPQISVLLIAVLIGFLLREKPINLNFSDALKGVRKLPLYIFGATLIVLVLLSVVSKHFELMLDFFLSGSYVFGGGHVVLPILEDTVGSEMSNEAFLLGYSSAQAIPGPMFTLGTYLGAVSWPGNSLVGACAGTLMIFLPGFLLVFAFNDVWKKIINIPAVASISHCLNAAVVGLLLSALYDPVFTSAILSGRDLAIAIGGLILLKLFKLHIFFLVLASVAIGYFL